MKSPTPKPGFQIPTALILAALVAATFLLYWPVRENEFIHLDDPDYVWDNPHITGGLTAGNTAWAFRTHFSSNWHPITWISHMLDCQLFGVKPAPHHLMNVAFHAVNALLLFGLLRWLTRAVWPAVLVAALFAVHPLHVESVAWSAERKDVLSTFFGLLALWAYARYVEESKAKSQRSKVMYGGALALFALGLMSKPMLVTWPFVMLLLDFWPLQRFNIHNSPFTRLRQLVLEKIPFFALSLASCVITFLVQRSEGSVLTLNALPVHLRVTNALTACAKYVAKTFWPTDLAVFYPFHPADLAGGQFAVAVLFVVAMSGAALVWLKRRPYFAVGWFWFLGTLVPVIGLVQVGEQAMADRYTYIPHIGLFILLAWGAAELAGRWGKSKTPLALAGVVAIALCARVTREQLRYWRNDQALFEHALAVTGPNHVANTILGALTARAGDPAKAIGYLTNALALAPSYADAHYNLGCAYQLQGKHSEAIASLRESLRLLPGHADASQALGVSLFKLGQFAEAETNLRAVLQLKPDNADAQLVLAMTLHNLGKLDQAKPLYEAALKKKPDNVTAAS